jgi:hypothetical protein
MQDSSSTRAGSALRARILGYVDVEDFVRPSEIGALLQLEYNDNYSKFVFGEWKNCVLANASGTERDCDLHEYVGSWRPTDALARLAGIRALLAECFDCSALKWLRVFVQGPGALLPHVDFLGMKEGFSRLHIPLRTSLLCMHSESDVVYHMRAGEIWYLEASVVHSAANLSTVPRVSLCLDFASGGDTSKLVRPAMRAKAEGRTPHLVERRSWSAEDTECMEQLAAQLSAKNFDAAVRSIIELHFQTDIPAPAVFSWLTRIAAGSGQRELIEHAAALQTLASGSLPERETPALAAHSGP